MPEDPVKTPSPGDGTDPTIQTASTGGDSGSTGGGEGRTLENLRGELLRKHGQLAEQVAALSQGIKTLTDRFVQPQPGQPPANPYGAPANPQLYGPGPVSPFGAPRQLSNFSDEQLAGALGSASVNDYQKGIIKQELDERRQERRFDQMFQQRDREQRVNGLKAQAEKAAFDSFPALRDPSSEFSKKVEAELQQQHDLGIVSPMEKFDVANRVARAMGMEVHRAVVPGYTAPAGGERPVESRREAQAPSLSTDEIEALAKKFEHTLPIDVKADGRSVRRKFDKKRIADLSKQYGEVQHVYRSRGIKVSD